MEQHLQRMRCLSIGCRLVPGLWSFASYRAKWWSIVEDVGTLSSGPDKCQEGQEALATSFQQIYWLSGSDLFQVFGALRLAELSGGALGDVGTLSSGPDKCQEGQERRNEK